MPGVERFRVEGGGRLQGEVRVTGAKNSVLKLMAAALLAEGESTIVDVPAILDTEIMAELLRRLGCGVVHETAASTVRIDVPDVPGHEADYDLVRRMRASICVLGPLLARCGQVSVARPGGDNIGSRPLDMHISGLERLGATVETEHGFIVAKAPHGLTGAQVWLDFPSVGATENILMAAVLARGTTVIDNAAREPEIVDLCLMLEQMGARIGGAGTSTLEIEGVDRLTPTTHVSVPDRIVAGTWAYAAAMTRGDVLVRNGRAEHLEIALDKLVRSGATVERVAAEGGGEGGFRVRMEQRPKAVDVVTLPFPGFATDLLPMVLALNSVADGAAMVTENVFEARFMFVDELARLGADVRTDGHHCVVRGKERLSGAPVRAHDIRAGAGLIMAGLVADGVTTVSDAYHVDRGYPGFTDQLRSLGVDVSREPDPDAMLEG
ncbi:UDP-N-acetylglucosamine 1-carboxyvinyltransferase [Motilibacter sp. K478]|nr:UDP-N-acetylglucosamine 1-carboxyvinyltransferase [Motilibacter aurantiacus]NHC44762.1 UDP-N-acetylglucosamine 1-carboxyvinyltransferase [Motilibacter aurantiacus]